MAPGGGGRISASTTSTRDVCLRTWPSTPAVRCAGRRSDEPASAWRHGRNPGHGPRAQSSELAGQGRSWTHVHGSACSLRDGSRGSRQPRARSERRGRIIGRDSAPPTARMCESQRVELSATPAATARITQGPRTQSAVISHGLHACASSATTQHLSAR